MEHQDVVIIGGGPAGRTIVHALRAEDKDRTITLIKDEPVNVNRCAVPYGINGKKPIEKYQIPNSLVTDFNADLVIDRVTDIDPDLKQVRTRKDRIFGYRHLVLATGSRPVIPPIEGIDGEGITPVRSLADLARLRELAEEGKKAVIVGGGYIGIEVAVALNKMGMHVTVVEMLPSILMATTEPEFIATVADKLNEMGIRLMTEQRVAAFDHSAGGVGVELSGGACLDADLVVLSVGVTPNMEMAAEAGIRVSRQGIWVDHNLRTSAPDVFACGDCAEAFSFINRQPVRGEFGTNAVFMGKVVARNILGHSAAFPGVLNANATTVYDLSLGSAGFTEAMAREAGIDVVTGFSTVMDKYPMMDGVTKIRTKLIFDRRDRKLVGGSVLRNGHGASQNVDFIAFAIHMGATLDNLMWYQYATHPELAAKPSDNTYVFAARDARSKL